VERRGKGKKGLGTASSIRSSKKKGELRERGEKGGGGERERGSGERRGASI